MNKQKVSNNKNKIMLLIAIISVVGIIVGVSYAYIMYNQSQKSINEAGTDCINIELLEESDAISLVGSSPMSDSQGSSTKPYKFTITNTCNMGVDYSVNLEVMNNEDKIESKNIKTRVDGNSIRKLTESESKSMVK